jgi:hypothetical protein
MQEFKEICDETGTLYFEFMIHSRLSAHLIIATNRISLNHHLGMSWSRQIQAIWEVLNIEGVFTVDNATRKSIR